MTESKNISALNAAIHTIRRSATQNMESSLELRLKIYRMTGNARAVGSRKTSL